MDNIRAAHHGARHSDIPILRVFHLPSWWVFAFLLLALSSCSVALALKQPEKKNLNVLNPGTARAIVIRELGLPTRTDEFRGERVDAFTISEGYSREGKWARAGLHMTVDAYTFGLWEPFGIILEKYVRPPDISYEVHYDAYDRVTNWNVLSNNILLGNAPPETPSVGPSPPIIPSVTPVLMPQLIAETPQRLAVIFPQGSQPSFISSGLDLALAYLRTFHPTMTIVERDSLEPLTQELVLQHMGKVQDDTMARIGGWKGADALLIVQIEQTSTDRLQRVAQRGGEVAHSVEIRLAQVETGILLFRQATLARVQIPPPGSTQPWHDELLEDAQRETLRVAYTHSLAALAASFGDNPLGLVPDLSSSTGAIRLLGLLHGGPGHKAGLQKGDRILEVDGVPYTSITQRITLPSKLLVEQQNERKDVRVEARIPGS